MLFTIDRILRQERRSDLLERPIDSMRLPALAPKFAPGPKHFVLN